MQRLWGRIVMYTVRKLKGHCWRRTEKVTGGVVTDKVRGSR